MPDFKQRMKKWFFRTGQHGKTGHSLTMENRSLNLDESSQSSEGTGIEKFGESHTVGDIVPYVENTDTLKSRIAIPRRIGSLERWFRRTSLFWRPPLTGDEADELKRKKFLKAQDRRMRIECMKANKLIVNSYASCGVEYVRTSHNRHERDKIEYVHFAIWRWSADCSTIYGKVDRIPYKIFADELVSDRVLTNLSLSLGRPVLGHCDDKGGGVLISVSLAGTLDIPQEVDFDYGLSLIAESAPPMSVFLGVGVNSKKWIYNLEEAPHLLIGGSTGSGKSVALTGIIATLIARNSPKDVRLLLADMKGVDLNLFEGTPHLLTGEIDEIPDGIVKKDNQIVPLFEWLEKENNRRQVLFSNRRIRNISEWNKKNRKYHLARIIVCVDEFARLMRSDYEKKKFINLIYDLASTARATGIYLILATQFAKDKYVSTDIKMNIPARLCFSVPDLQGSVCMIDTGEAVNLYPPAGRGIFAHGVNKFKIQSPLITSKQILEIVRKAQQGKTVKELEEGTDLTEEEVVTWALNENNGSLQTLNTFQHFAGRLEANNLKKMLQGMDGKIFVIDDVEYRIVPPAGGARGRKLEKVELEKEVENE